MIRRIGRKNVPCPEDVWNPARFHNPDLARPEKKLMRFLEVYPSSPKEIAWYGSIDRNYRCHAGVYPHHGPSPLLVEMGTARSLGLI